MHESRDLGATLVVSAALLLVVGYLTQCAPAARRVVSDTSAPATVSVSRHTSAAEQEERANERQPKSIREVADEEEHEEAEKIKRVAHALQTIGANPEMRATLGLPP